MVITCGDLSFWNIPRDYRGNCQTVWWRYPHPTWFGKSWPNLRVMFFLKKKKGCNATPNPKESKLQVPRCLHLSSEFRQTSRSLIYPRENEAGNAGLIHPSIHPWIYSFQYTCVEIRRLVGPGRDTTYVEHEPALCIALAPGIFLLYLPIDSVGKPCGWRCKSVKSFWHMVCVCICSLQILGTRAYSNLTGEEEEENK